MADVHTNPTFMLDGISAQPGSESSSEEETWNDPLGEPLSEPSLNEQERLSSPHLPDPDLPDKQLPDSQDSASDQHSSSLAVLDHTSNSSNQAHNNNNTDIIDKIYTLLVQMQGTQNERMNRLEEANARLVQENEELRKEAETHKVQNRKLRTEWRRNVMLQGMRWIGRDLPR